MQINDDITIEGNEKIARYRKKKLIVTLIVVVVVCILAMLFYYFGIKNRVYKKYIVENKIDISSVGNVGYLPYSDGMIRYSAEGVSYYVDGKEVWNKSINMTDPCIDVCGDYVVIAERGSNDIVLFDLSGSEQDFTATYPIVNVSVSKNGTMAATLDDGEANYIEITTKDGEKIASGRTVLSGDGYPIDVSISEDGAKVVASYLSVGDGAVKSKVVFYNFSEVGENEVDRVVGGFNQYEDSIVPDVEFINKNTAIALADNMFTIYEIDEKPTKKYEEKFENEKIISSFYSDSYIGFVLENAKSGENVIQVYDINGKKIISDKTEYIYTDIQFNEKNILMYNDENITMYSFSYKKIFDKNYKGKIVKVIPINKTHMIVISDNKAEIIKLK